MWRAASSRSTPCIAKKTFEAAADAQAHLIVQLKDNQPTLCRKVETVCNDARPLSAVQTIDSKKRNRHETRTVAVFDARSAVRGTEWQPHVKAIIAVERRVLTFKPATGLWDSSSECAFYLSNRPVLAGQAADAIRKHWGIENKRHPRRHLPRRRIPHPYWTIPEMNGWPFVIAIQDFHFPGSMRSITHAATEYVFGVRHSFEKGERKVERIADHVWGNAREKSGFFFLPGAENISAVIVNLKWTPDLGPVD